MKGGVRDERSVNNDTSDPRLGGCESSPLGCKASIPVSLEVSNVGSMGRCTG